MTELLPCPFCGKVPQVYPDDNINHVCMAFVDKFTSKDDWNTRPIESALREQLEQERMPEMIKETLIDCVTYAMNDFAYTGIEREQIALDWLNGKAVK